MQGRSQPRSNLSPDTLRGRGFNVPGALFKHKRSGRWTVKLHIGNGRYQQRYFATRAEAEAYQASLASHPLHAANVGIFGTARERLREHIHRWLRRQERGGNAGAARAWGGKGGGGGGRGAACPFLGGGEGAPAPPPPLPHAHREWDAAQRSP